MISTNKLLVLRVKPQKVGCMIKLHLNRDATGEPILSTRELDPPLSLCRVVRGSWPGSDVTSGREALSLLFYCTDDNAMS